MNQFQETETAINRDIDRVFQEVYEEIRKNYFVTGNDDLERLQSAISQYVPRMIANKKWLLLDTTLNYLTEDAIRNLEGYESKVPNSFYQQNRDFREKRKVEFQHSESKNSVLLSPDPRFVYSAVSGVGGCILGGLIGINILKLEFPILPTFAVVSAIGGAIVTYYNTTSIAMQKIEEDVMEYLQKSQTQAKEELNKTIESYSDEFNNFLKEHISV
ncbi:hypothetical protein PI95_007165 [Hassallia byssoidea VB512170]|uniref:Uncharacterized protein n=2 Tax=Hassallia TaxID=482629 RepID=A0A846H6Y1_9CYAN|nr:hypothetical protein [Hassalia byssoidea VB512170]